MHCILFDGEARTHLLPFTYTRPVAALRIGILTIQEKWAKHYPATYSIRTEHYLSAKYPEQEASVSLFINGALCPNPAVVDALHALSEDQALYAGEHLLAVYGSNADNPLEQGLVKDKVDFKGEVRLIDRPWKLFAENGAELEADFDLLTKNRSSAPLSDTNTLIGDRIFAEEGATAEAAILNSKTGPIYLAKDASIMEGSMVRGALSLGEHAQLKLGAKIYGPTTIGPHSKVGGEVSNSVILGYSNKGHDGFLGNSVLGEWCNLGADTNTSNLKNNYEQVKLWSFGQQRFVPTGQQFCGLMMGDHSKCGINTMFNTGTVVGVSANIFGSGFPRNYVPSFSWGGASGFVEYRLDKALTTATLVMERRGIALDETEAAILEHIYKNTER
jgi:UDP-N-acetylglucosamine diphosphorylase/glucosamine-1-phosphate N-acetyltransferase